MDGSVNPLSADPHPAESRASTHAVDRLVASSASIVIAMGWGMAEATFFFLVPDIFLTILACRSFRRALIGSIAALSGALAGGVIMYVLGRASPETALLFLDSIPAINAELIVEVRRQLSEQGVRALMIGPIMGIPYKIYAVEWGAAGGNLIPFILVSIPARYLRFIITAVLAYWIARAISPLTRQRAGVEVFLLAVCWMAFYTYYFMVFGL